MTDENGMQAPAPAAHEGATTPADQQPAEHHEHFEQPADSPEPESYDEQFAEGHEEPADLGGILEDRPRKPSGAQRAKAQKEYLQNELRQREDRIAELERHIHEDGERWRGAESERHAEAQRKREEAHKERLKSTRETVTDFDRVMAKMRGVEVRDELIEEIKSSDKSALLAYHLASHPDKLAELNHMSDRQRTREIGRLEASLKLPAGKKQTTAPPPPTNLKGGAAPHANPNTGPADMSSFAAWLKRDLARRSGRGEKQ